MELETMQYPHLNLFNFFSNVFSSDLFFIVAEQLILSLNTYFMIKIGPEQNSWKDLKIVDCQLFRVQVFSVTRIRVL